MAKHKVEMEYTLERIKSHIHKEGELEGTIHFSQGKDIIETGNILVYLYEFYWGTAEQRLPYEGRDPELAEILGNPMEKGREVLAYSLKGDLEVILSNINESQSIATITIHGEPEAIEYNPGRDGPPVNKAPLDSKPVVPSDPKVGANAVKAMLKKIEGKE